MEEFSKLSLLSASINAIALLVSGQSSTITGTYVGQYIMQVILSFELPFSLIPLLKFSSSATKMGPHKNSVTVIVISWMLGFGIIGVNIYYLSTGFVDWLIHNSLPRVANVFVGIIVFPLMAVYEFAVMYLTFRRDTVVTFIEPTKHNPTKLGHTESRLKDADGQEEEDEIPYREDLADIPLPE
ncbi:hypothetical protein NL676_027775 [Syzygium grande]|nr:hypothetical protein NL676_027775 [Syzygium grande]